MLESIVAILILTSNLISTSFLKINNLEALLE